MKRKIFENRILQFTSKDNPSGHESPILSRHDDQTWQLRFKAMASPCEILLEFNGASAKQVEDIVRPAVCEVWRIEAKYSRYRQGNIIHLINNAGGQTVAVDSETAQLLDYANQCFQLSGGKFDITSGPLRRVWSFKGGVFKPDHEAIQCVLAAVGWPRCQWQKPQLTLPAQAEIDFGGIGKEYAVDRCLQIIASLITQSEASVLLNFGGDIVCSGPRQGQKPWIVGIEKAQIGGRMCARSTLHLFQGALATSGDTYRYALVEEKRVSHILDPQTGWPIEGAPQSVTVAAHTCTLAGMLATFAMLQGAQAEAFLQAQGFEYWVQRV